MRELAEQIDKISIDHEQEIVDNVSALIAAVIKILNDNASTEELTLADGSVVNRSVVKRSKLRKVLTELRKLEKQTSDIVYDGTLSSMEAALLATTTFYKERFKSIVVKGTLKASEIAKEPSVDGLTLKDRTDTQSMRYTDDLYKQIRVSINKGHSISEIIDEVGDTFKGKEWELRRIVTTETFDAYRTLTGEIAEKSGLTWIKLHESFPRHPRRRRHTCFAYAHEDKYGKGPGVFKPTDMKIYSPHPQCTSWLELLELEKEVSDDVD